MTNQSSYLHEMYFPSISTTKEYKQLLSTISVAISRLIIMYIYAIFYISEPGFFIWQGHSNYWQNYWSLKFFVKNYCNNNDIPYIIYCLPNYPTADYNFPGMGFGERDWILMIGFYICFYEMSHAQILSL